MRSKPFPSVGNPSGRDLGEEEKKLLEEVIDSAQLNRNVGSKVVQFEKEFAEKYGTKYAIASTSGTAALHIAIGSLNLEPGDEVITTTITDMGTVIAILLCNLIPIFADVDPLTCNIEPDSIKKKLTEKTKAIIPVHIFGQSADMDPILKIAREHNLYVIEDCCQAHLAEYKGKLVGTLGDLGCFSFQQSKQITTGDGGMTITNNEELAKRAKLFSDKGWPRGGNGQRGHLFLAPNYRMTELQGAVGLAQLRKIDSILARRRKSAQALTNLIKEVKGINPPKIIEGALPSWWIYSFTTDEDLLGASKDFEKALKAEGIPFRLGYIANPVFSYEMIRERRTYGTSRCPWDCPRARKNIEYKEEDYPNTMRALEKVFVMSWNEGITEQDCSDLAEGIKKTAGGKR
jgi:dTDP-4-amino-4,6-dideoxygalactose transaminase